MKRTQQRGMTLLSFIVVLAVVGFAAYIGMKLFSMYSEYYSVRQALRGLQAEPGIAKLIGVLNLQSLPRRLNFDFRDVFAQGFAFDEIRGGAALLRGVARTEDLVMNGLQARVNLRGEVDLVRETQSLVVAVQPQVDDLDVEVGVLPIEGSHGAQAGDVVQGLPVGIIHRGVGDDDATAPGEGDVDVVEHGPDDRAVSDGAIIESWQGLTPVTHQVGFQHDGLAGLNQIAEWIPAGRIEGILVKLKQAQAFAHQGVGRIGLALNDAERILRVTLIRAVGRHSGVLG